MRIFINSAEAVTPKLQALMGHAKALACPDVAMQFSDRLEAVTDSSVVLSLGKYVAKGRERVVSLPSGKALLSRADSISRLITAFRLLTDPPTLEPMKWRLYDDKENLYELLGVLAACGDRVMVVDIETSGAVDEDLPTYERVISLGIFGGTAALVIGENLLYLPEVKAAVIRFLETNRIIAHNAKFDLKYFDAVNPNLFFDPMLAHYCLFPAGGEHGLKPLAEIYFGAKDWDSANKEYTKAATYKEAWRKEDGSWADARKYPGGSGYERIPRAMLYEYNAMDVYWTWQLYILFEQYLADDPDATRVFQKRLLLSGMFRRMEQKGFTIDTEYLLELRRELQEERVILWAELRAIAGFEINPNSHVQVKKWFADNDRELPKRKNTKNKLMPSSSEDALDEVIEGGKFSELSIQFAHKLLECRGNTKSLGTYVEGFLNAAHGATVHPRFNISGPLTGRLANQGAGGIMTMPRDPKYRKMIVPSGPGRVLVKPDYGQLEMRLVAFFCRDPRFVAAFQPGMPDFFTGMMPEVYPDIDLSTQSKSQLKALRNGVKPISHGANYGRSAAAIAKQLGMPIEEATAIFDRYMGSREEGLYPWQADIKDKARNNQNIVTPFGFHYQAEVITDKNKSNVENSALAFMPQSTGNDICLDAAIQIEPQLKQYDSWMVATIHDQIIVDAPVEDAKSVGMLMEHEMLEAARRVVGDVLVFEAEPEYGFSWPEAMNPKEWDTWLTTNKIAG